MNYRKITAILLAAVISASMLTACGGKGGSNESSSTVSSQSAVSSQAGSSSEESSAATSVEAASTASSEVLSQPAESENGPVISVQTDDKEFDKKFAGNPIDKAYIKDNAAAISNVDMVNVSDKYTEIWKKEITHAYAELENHMKLDSSKKPQQLKAEQEQWVSGADAALKKISEEAQAAGGSMAQVNEASKRMDYYRNRAAQLYRELYAYNKNYSYEYKAK